MAQFRRPQSAFGHAAILCSPGWVAPALLDQLSKLGIEVHKFNQVMPDPTLEVVQQGVQAISTPQAVMPYWLWEGFNDGCCQGHRSGGRKPKPARSPLGLLKVRTLLCRCTSSDHRRNGSEVTLAVVISETVQGATIKSLVIDPKLVPVAAQPWMLG